MKLNINGMLLGIAMFFGGLVFQSSAMESGPEIWVRNDSTWPVQINYMRNGKPEVVQLDAGSKPVKLGKSSEVNDATYHSSMSLKSWPIDFKGTIKPSLDLLLILTTSYLGNWVEKFEYLEPGKLATSNVSKKESPLPEKSSSSARTAEDSMVWVRNDSNYKIQVNSTPKEGKELKHRLGVGQRIKLGKASTLVSASYQAYGDVWGKTSLVAWPLDIQGNIKADSDLLFRITTWLQGFSVKPEYLVSGEIPVGEERKEGEVVDPWDLFENDEAKTAFYNDDKEKAYRAIMGLTPHYTKDELKKSYVDLSREWHPDKGTRKEARDGRAMQIIIDANKYLNNKFSS